MSYLWFEFAPSCTSFHATATATASLSTSLRPHVQERNWKIKWQQIQARLPKLAKTRTEPRSADAIHAATQDLFGFFVSAYHLKDAIIGDGVVPTETVEEAITANSVLSLLADLANLEKHHHLKSRPRSGEAPVIEIADLSDGSRWSLKLTIRHKGRSIDGLEFAVQIVEEWRQHLKGWALANE